MDGLRNKIICGVAGASGGLAGALSLANCAGGACASCLRCLGFAGAGILIAALGRNKKSGKIGEKQDAISEVVD
ncbi:MAG: hypothetical protein M0Z58_06435 [Nitrospiraceae bacterium]|nr:hypothetical protein [Nitrospiraceae bacterium]